MRKIGITFLLASMALLSFGQETDVVIDNEDAIEVLNNDTLPKVVDCTGTLRRSWRKSYPFKTLPINAYFTAVADTNLIRDKKSKKKVMKYSEAKLASDSLHAVLKEMPLDPSYSLGLTDYRLPIFVNASSIPVEQQLSLLDFANGFTHEDWDYVKPANRRFQQMLETQNIRKVQTYNYVKGHPSRYSYVSGAMDLPPILDDEEVSTEKSLEGRHLDIGKGASKTMSNIGDIQSLIKTDHWHHNGSSTFQMSQTAFSDNWYKGGDNNMVLSTTHKLELSTFDENKKTSFDVLLDLRLSALYTKADTVNPLRVNDNQFAATIKYGYKAWKRWYYSTSLYAKTPVFDSHNTNSAVTKSALFAPLETNVSVGMEYKYNSNDKRLQFTLMLAPLAYNMKYVSTSRVNETSYGIEVGKKTDHKFGATVNSSLTWKISNSFSWTSRLYYFTSYDYIQAEFENTFSLNLSRRFTCQLYLYPRFDDSFDDKIQMKEMLTFGLNYVW